MPEACQRGCPLGLIDCSGARGKYRRCKTIVIELQLARENLFDERCLLANAFIGSSSTRCGQRRIVARHGWRILGNERLHALDSQPVRSPANAWWEHELLLAKHTFKVNFLVLNEVDRTDGRHLRERERTAEDRSRVWVMSIDGFDIEDAHCTVDVPCC